MVHEVSRNISTQRAGGCVYKPANCNALQNIMDPKAQWIKSTGFTKLGLRIAVMSTAEVIESMLSGIFSGFPNTF